MTKVNLIEQLLDFYHKYDWKDSEIPDEKLKVTLDNLLMKKRYIFCHNSDGNLVGYTETWRINYEQLGRIICKLPFDVGIEDIESGNIAYIANITIHPEWRNGDVLHSMKVKFMQDYFDCDYFIGVRRKGKYEPLIVMNRKEYKTYIDKFLKSEAV